MRAERNYEPGRWISYDHQFRREALARRDLNWSGGTDKAGLELVGDRHEAL